MRGVIQTTSTLITPPQSPPMTVDYARKHIKALGNEEDLLIESWILAAASFFEEQTGRQIITATYELWLDRFPCETMDARTGAITGRRIELPHPPLQDVVSVQYIDGDGNLASFTDGASPETPFYRAKTPAGDYAPRGWVEPIYGYSWPTARDESGAVRIQHTCGYGDSPDDVPSLVTGILCYLIGNFDQFRSATSNDPQRATIMEVPLGMRMLLDGFKYTAYPREAPLR